MSFNRRRPDRPRDRGPDRGDRPRPDRPDRPERRFDRPPRSAAGDWQPRDRGDARGGPRPDRPFVRNERPYAPRGRNADDEGAMSIRLDPRRLSTLKQLAGEAGTRPGELVRIWVEERLDAERRGSAGEGVGPAAGGLSAQLAALAERVSALEAARGGAGPSEQPAIPAAAPHAESPAPDAGPAADEPMADADSPESSASGARPKRGRRNAVSASPSGPRVALHDEIIAVIGERGPLPAAELAAIITERGRYAPPRSGKPLDALTVNARVSNPTYRARFTRSEGRIGLASPAEA